MENSDFGLEQTEIQKIKTIYTKDIPSLEFIKAQYFDFIEDPKLQQVIAQEFYGAMYIEKIQHIFASEDIELHAHLKFQIIQYASIYEAIIDYILITEFINHKDVKSLIEREEFTVSKESSKDIRIIFKGEEMYLSKCKKKAVRDDFITISFGVRIDIANKIGFVEDNHVEPIKRFYDLRNSTHIRRAAKKGTEFELKVCQEAHQILLPFITNIKNFTKYSKPYQKLESTTLETRLEGLRDFKSVSSTSTVDEKNKIISFIANFIRDRSCNLNTRLESAEHKIEPDLELAASLISQLYNPKDKPESKLNLEDVCLIGLNLEAVNLSYANLSRAILKKSNFSKSNFNFTDLSYADLEGINLSKAKFRETDLSRANLTGANLEKASLINVDLWKANLSNANLNGSTLRKVLLEESNFYNAQLIGTELKELDLKGVNFSDADLSHANLRSADLSDANLSNANLSGADLRDADLRDADLSGADLSDADLSNANLRNANLSNANLTNTTLRKANLIDTNLSEANLSLTILRKANLSGALVFGATLFRTNLFRAILEDVNLDDANIIELEEFGSKYDEDDEEVEREF